MKLPRMTRPWRVTSWRGLASHARAAGEARSRARTGLGSARERFERRAVAARRRPRLLMAAALGLALLVVWLVWLGWFSSVLTATSVTIEGPARGTVEAAEVEQVAAVPLGQPLMRVDTRAVTERLVAHRAYSSVSVSRSLPHTIVIVVEPRKPALAAQKPDGQVDLVDAEGFVFRSVTAAPKGVPVVTARSDGVTASGLKAAIAALEALDPALRKTVTGVAVGAADQVSLTLKPTTGKQPGERTVIWGGLGDEARKSRLVTILAGEPGETIDVSVPDSPVTR